MAEQEHDHHWPEGAPPGGVSFCVEEGCTELAVFGEEGWREPTTDELFAITAHMMEAIVIAEAMKLIHGRERGMRRARQVLGYAD